MRPRGVRRPDGHNGHAGVRHRRQTGQQARRWSANHLRIRQHRQCALNRGQGGSNRHNF